MPDLQLFEVAATEKVDALITHDVAQMKGLDRRDERKKCFECGIHWLGLPHQNRATGKNRASSAAGTFISNLGYAIQTFESASEPTAILLLPSPAGLQSESPYPQIVKP
ncbi:hypothetical protein [Corynebacterium sp.]|uniref:hypothetical protein n=1 Tax=Corynebacterium sp. TaxID=1720 RepID=UPI0028AEBF33|nr:hypothetical protein [Corynebacterium sp.]